MVEIFPRNACPLKQLDSVASIQDIRSKQMEESCHCEFVVEYPSEAEGGRRVGRTERDGDDCPCCTFYNFGCIPNVVEVRDASILIETYVEDRDQAFDLMRGLDEASGRTELTRITQSDKGSFSTPLSQVDLSSLTEKQREALDAAVEGGYFETPKGTTLEDLADEFGISKQAFGQRLCAAERKVMQQIGRSRS